MSKRWDTDTFKYLSQMTSLGLALATPVLLCVLAGAWLQRHFGLGNWVLLIFVILGVGSAVMTLVKFCRQVIRDSERRRKELEDQ